MPSNVVLLRVDSPPGGNHVITRIGAAQAVAPAAVVGGYCIGAHHSRRTNRLHPYLATSIRPGLDHQLGCCFVRCLGGVQQLCHSPRLLPVQKGAELSIGFAGEPGNPGAVRRPIVLSQRAATQSPAPFPPEGCAAGAGGFFACVPGTPITAPPPIDTPLQNGGVPAVDVPSPGDLAGSPTSEGGGQTCRAPNAIGNPILGSVGNKYQREVDYAGPGLLTFIRHYNSSLKTWVHNHLMRLQVSGSTATAIRPDGKVLVFTGTGVGAWSANATVSETLTRMDSVNVGDAAWRLVTASDTVELYDINGLPLYIVGRGGHSLRMAYGNGYLQSVTDQFGRSLLLTYDEQGRLATVTAPSGEAMRYAYDGKELSEVWVVLTWFMLILSFPAGTVISLVHLAIGEVFATTVKTSYLSLGAEWSAYFVFGLFAVVQTCAVPRRCAAALHKACSHRPKLAPPLRATSIEIDWMFHLRSGLRPPAARPSTREMARGGGTCRCPNRHWRAMKGGANCLRRPVEHDPQP